jgi:acetyl-CoA/propionyl-CoA carboxylase, biotin carboxylase, biotin carboxyl carrier protein
VERVLGAAVASGADAVHPGYGFLSENADFAQAVLDAGLVWVGPPPSAIRLLGDKVSARGVASRAGAPLVAGTAAPVSGAGEVVAFAREHGLPVAIKAAFGGGGRGLKVARELGEIPELYESAVREAVAAFGRGECFVERYLERPRHVETQCLADSRGNVVVVSTRDCSLQRRHQKLVEEAPAPFLSQAQVGELYRASKAILREAGYVGAGTCEFLVGADGTVSFLEVNTRLQVEHPVSEEVTGLDLVVEQLRIARGEALGYGDPEVRGHSIEFRVNGEDAGRGFLPAPGVVGVWRAPSGPGVRVDAGVESGSVVGQEFDSLLAKLVVTGRDRAHALARARRALAEFEVGGLATVLPFHRAVVVDAAFAPADPSEVFGVHTRWIETEFVNEIAAFAGPVGEAGEDVRERVTVEVGGRRLEVVLPAGLGAGAVVSGGAGVRRAAPRRGGAGAGRGVAGAGGDGLGSPMQGTIVKVAVVEGQVVAAGDLVVVLEAMKMEQPLTAHKAGTVVSLTAQVGATVSAGAILCEIKD